MSPSSWSIKKNAGNSLFLQLPSPTKPITIETNTLHHSLGNLVSGGNNYRWLACSRINRYWMEPFFGGSSNANNIIPFDTQFLLLEIEKKNKNASEQQYYYALLLPLVDGGYRASLKGEKKDNNDVLDIVCHSEGITSDESSSSSLRMLYVSISDDSPYALLERSFDEVSSELKTFLPLKKKSIPKNFLNEFGWCTWDAFYSKVTPEGILQGVQSLRNAGIPPRTVIIDDGWQRVLPEAPKKTTKEKESGLMRRLRSLLYDSLAKIVGLLYEKFVQDAPHNSIPNRIWRFLAHNTAIVKNSLWNYYDTQSDFARQLNDFEPNHKFQEEESNNNKKKKWQLKDLVSQLKHSNDDNDVPVGRVYCWHALHGYWRGLDTKFARNVAGLKSAKNIYFPNPSDHVLTLEPAIAWDPVSLFSVGLVTSPSDVATFYQKLHQPLVDAGIDGVKVDVQSGVSGLIAGGAAHNHPNYSKLYTEAMERSVSQNFRSSQKEDDAAAINSLNCMCHSTENLYRYQKTSMARAGDDFFPLEKDQTKHIRIVAYNSLFVGEICRPDWDMFHSDHPYASLHAASRAVSGSPVYVSDPPNKHDASLLSQLVLPDGTVLQCAQHGKPTRDCIWNDPATSDNALKIWNRNTWGGGIVGAFHLKNYGNNNNNAPTTTDVFVKPYDIESLHQNNEKQQQQESSSFVAWKYRAKTMEILFNGYTDISPTTLEHSEYEIFTVVPIQKYYYNIKDDNDNVIISWAPIGLVNMFNSGGALQDVEPIRRDDDETTTSFVDNTILSEEESNNKKKYNISTRFKCRGPGQFVAYCQPIPQKVLLLDNLLSFSYDDANGKLSFDLPKEDNATPHQIHILW